MRIPPRTLVALCLLVLGTGLAAWMLGVLWVPEAGGFLVGAVMATVGILMGVSE